jgi:hypothetical protein
MACNFYQYSYHWQSYIFSRILQQQNEIVFIILGVESKRFLVVSPLQYHLRYRLCAHKVIKILYMLCMSAHRMDIN